MGESLSADPMQRLQSRGYLGLLLLAAIIGVPVASAAYFFLELTFTLQPKIFRTLPLALGFHAEPLWWPLPILVLSGVLVGLSIKYLPGTSGHSPADGFHVGGPPVVLADLPGIALAGLASLALGVVLGPEAPLIAIGGGLGVLAVRLARRDAPPATTVVMAAAGSFAAISTIFGSPILGAFLLMEASGLGGPVLGLVLVPGLLSAGIGYLIFVGLNSWTGFGTFTLAIPHLPAFTTPDAAEFGWALVIGVGAALLGVAIRRLALLLRSAAKGRVMVATPLAGVGVALIAMLFEGGTGRGSTVVLFSGQTALGPLVGHAASWSAGALVLLLLCKSVAYIISLSSFRGGPVFPALFVGAVGGMALSHAPGLPLVPALAMGIGALCVAMLKLPLTSVLLASLLVAHDGYSAMPLVIVAVTVTYVVSARLDPATSTSPSPSDADVTAPGMADPGGPGAPQAP
jgi:H+/Cl- antiporter ClcA